jgi:hypothetical protein
MSYYTPDKWMLVKITGDDPHYRVFGSWYGGYNGADSWRMNSGISKVIEEDDHYLFIGSSGSTYACHKDAYGANMYGMGVAKSYEEKMAPHFIILDEVDGIETVNKNEWGIE